MVQMKNVKLIIFCAFAAVIHVRGVKEPKITLRYTQIHTNKLYYIYPTTQFSTRSFEILQNNLI